MRSAGGTYDTSGSTLLTDPVCVFPSTPWYHRGIFTLTTTTQDLYSLRAAATHQSYELQLKFRQVVAHLLGALGEVESEIYPTAESIPSS